MIDAQTLNIILTEPSTKWMGIAFTLVLLLSAIAFLLAKTLPVLKTIVKAFSKPEKDLVKFFKLREDIDNTCRDIKHDLQADRVSVYEYKNGEVSTANVPFMSIKITSESKSMYAESIMIDKDTIPSGIFTGINSMMIRGHMFECKDVNADDWAITKQHNMTLIQEYMQKHGTKSFYLFPMLKPSGRPLGFGLVEYVASKGKPNPDLITQSRGKFGSIGGILTVLSEVNGEK
jgi:hypothetical protein